MNSGDSPHLSRRRFLAACAAATAALAAPTILTAKKSEGGLLVIGEGDHRFEVLHDWPRLPDKFTWQTTHNVAIDKDGLLYVIHEGRAEQKDHPSIFVFDPEGRFVRAFGEEFQGGGHGIEVRQEGSEQFLYVCAYQQLKTFAKLTLDGETVWRQFAPMDSGVYAKGEDTDPQKVWGRDRFMPTNFAFTDDGGFFLADGYGSFYIHRYDKDARWQSCFGGPGEGRGKFNTPHGLWIDRRRENEQTLVVCDRANHTLQRMTLGGEYIETLDGYGLPANADTWRGEMVIPELFARVTILDAENGVLARLGDDGERIRADGKHAIRGDREQWTEGKFVHPHDACYDHAGNIFVAEWVAAGRITKLRRVS